MNTLLFEATKIMKAGKNQILLIGLLALETAKTAINRNNKSFTQALAILVLFGTLFGPMSSAATAPGLSVNSLTLLTEPNEVVLANAVPVEKRGSTTSSFYAIVTQYSYADSCHNVVDGKCLMASGRPVYVGAVACPRNLPLGTKVEIEGSEYRCEDRYATWVDAKRGMPTIDIFVSGNPKGNSVKVVNVIN